MGIREEQERVSERIEKVPAGRYVDGTLKASRVAERGRQRAIGNSVVVCVCVCVCVCVHEERLLLQRGEKQTKNKKTRTTTKINKKKETNKKWGTGAVRDKPFDELLM